jgi:hypothetical protein
MGQCQFKHKVFAKYTEETAYGYSGDGSVDQCWVSTDGPGNPRCIFHMQENKDVIGTDHLGDQQANGLVKLVMEWNQECSQRAVEGETIRALVLPGLQCGLVNFPNSGVTEFSGPFRWDNAVFKEQSSFKGLTFKFEARFDHTKFNEHAWFNGATFGGAAWFNRAAFGGMASFEDVTFSNTSLFLGATFEWLAFFVDTTFVGPAGFEEITFSGDVRFSNSIFSQNVNFDSSRFNGYLEVDQAWFLNTLTLSQNRFDFSSTFSGCYFHKLEYKTHTGERLFFNGCCTLDSRGGEWWDVETNKSTPLPTGVSPPDDEASGVLDFGRQHCAGLSFQNMYMGRSDFLGADLGTTRFISCRWKKEGEKGYEQVYLPPNYVEWLADGNPKSMNVVANLYKQLHKNLENDRAFVKAGAFHYREMALRQKQLRAEGGSREKIKAHLAQLWAERWNWAGMKARLAQMKAERENYPEQGLLWLYKGVSNFGESYMKLAMWMLVALIVFPFLAAVVGPSAFSDTFFHLFPWAFKGGGGQAVVPLFGGTKIVILVGQLTLLTLTALFVMAIRRRFRR